MKKCNGCKQEFESDSNLARCPLCVEKYLKPASITNNFWQLHPEIANLVDSDYKKEHFRVTTKSLIPIDITCNYCEQVMTISPKELLETGDCINCHQYLVKVDKKVLRNQVIDIIQKSNNFEEYEGNIKKCHFTSSQLGLIQEIFAQYYFTTHAHLYNIKQYLSYAFDKIDVAGMPVRDMGTDSIIIHNDGTKSLIQIKWKSKKICHNRSVFYGMGIDALNIENLKNLYLFSNSDSISNDLPTGDRFRYILYGTLKNIDWSYFKKNVVRVVKEKPLKLEKIVYRLWQTEAKQFVMDKKAVTISAACGTGKTLFSVGVIKDLGEKFKVLIVVPSLQLLSQWFYSLATHTNAEFLLVGSQAPTVDDNMNDVPYMVTTDQDLINNTIKHRDDKFIVISTYQSLKLINQTSFTSIFIDEAHWTVSPGNSYTLVTKKEFKAKQKIYLTATPKIYHGSAKEEKELSMDNEDIYGPQFTYSCRKAIEDGILCDYKVLLGVCKGVEEGYPASQRYQLYSKFLLKCIQDQGMTKVLIASNSHQSSLAFYNEFKKIYNGPTWLMKKNAKSKDKDYAISKLEKGCIVFNVRIFNLGVDIPCLEGVFFNGDKSSATDIVQTASRCLRIFAGKEKAFIMVPAFTGENLDVEIGDFPNVRNILLSLGAKDTAIWEEIFEKSLNAVGKSTKEKRIFCIGIDDVDIGEVELRIFDRMGMSQGLSNNIRFQLCIEYKKQHGKWPSRNCIENDIKLGEFWASVKSAFTLGNKYYQQELLQWQTQLEELEYWDELKKKFSEIIEKRQKEKLSVDEKFRLCLEYRKRTGKWPHQKCIENSINLGHFWNSVKCAFTKSNKYYQQELPQWKERLEELGYWDNLKTEFDKNVEKRKEEKITINEKFRLCLVYKKENGKWPSSSYIDKNGIKLGIFWTDVKCAFIGSNNRYKKELLQWQTQLEELGYWNELKDELNKIVEKRKISVNVKFQMCIEYKKINGKWPPPNCIENGLKLGGFWNDVKRAFSKLNKSYQKELLEWQKQLEELGYWDVLKEKLDKNAAKH